MIEQSENTFRLFSPLIDEFVTEFPTPSFELTLTLGTSCVNPTVVTITPADISSEIRTEGFDVPTTVYFYEFTLPVGPTDIVLTKLFQKFVVNEFYCAVNLTGLECRVVDAFVGGNTEAWMLFEALRAAEDCDECLCKKLCPIYSRLINILDGTTGGC